MEIASIFASLKKLGPPQRGERIKRRASALEPMLKILQPCQGDKILPTAGTPRSQRLFPPSAFKITRHPPPATNSPSRSRTTPRYGRLAKASGSTFKPPSAYSLWPMNSPQPNLNLNLNPAVRPGPFHWPPGLPFTATFFASNNPPEPLPVRTF